MMKINEIEVDPDKKINQTSAVIPNKEHGNQVNSFYK